VVEQSQIGTRGSEWVNPGSHLQDPSHWQDPRPEQVFGEPSQTLQAQSASLKPRSQVQVPSQLHFPCPEQLKLAGALAGFGPPTGHFKHEQSRAQCLGSHSQLSLQLHFPPPEHPLRN
jgi:hypothetical protein